MASRLCFHGDLERTLRELDAVLLQLAALLQAGAEGMAPDWVSDSTGRQAR